MKLAFSLGILSLSFLMFSCASDRKIQKADSSDKIAVIINNMTLEEKVGQLFVVRPEQIDPDITLEQLRIERNAVTTVVTNKIKINYQKYPVCGFAIFDQNIKSPQQLKIFTKELRKLGKYRENEIRPYIFIDEEGGVVARLANRKDFGVPKFNNMGIEAKKVKSEAEKKEIIRNAGKQIGAYLKEYDIDVDFAPVCDVNTNPKNPIIGERAFSNNPELAGMLALEFLAGLRENNIEGCLKHFPGHGDTATDTHLGFAKSNKNWDELVHCEMIPFKMGIDADAKFIMTAHIALPEFNGNSIPSTLSYRVLTEKLRNEMNFNGIIITDGMEMGAIHKVYDSGDAAVQAILAGVDIVLMPYDFEEAFNSVVQAVKNGEISETRLNESVERILEFKL